MTLVVGHIGPLLVGAALVLFCVSQISRTGGALHGLWQWHEFQLSKSLKFLFSKRTGKQIVRTQAVGSVVLFAGAVVLQNYALMLLVVPLWLTPTLYLSREADAKRMRIDALLSNWLTALANALRAAPAIGDALASSARLVPSPMREELDLVLKEMRLGMPLDRALRHARERIGTRNVSTAIATLLVARETGGDLPSVLDETANALREMERLEGVLRTRTAEGKGQAYLMGAMPFGLVLVLHWIDNTWFSQLTQSAVGYALIAVATLLWFGAIWTASKVLAVDM